MKLIRTLGISLVAAAASMSAMTTIASAQSLDDVLRAAQAEREAVRQENAQREREFAAERNSQQSKLADIRGKVLRATAESDRLDEDYKKNDDEIVRLTQELEERNGEFGELFGAARTAAEELRNQLDSSIISAQFPGRSSALKEMAASDQLPSVEELKDLYMTLLQEMTEQANVTSFDARVYATAGEPETVKVTRIGPFSAFAKGNYLIFDGESKSLKFLAKVPGANSNVNPSQAANTVEGYKGDGFVQGMIDPSLGTLLGLSVERATVKDIIDQGGNIGKIIIAIAILGILLGIYKMFSLFMTGSAVRGQMRRKSGSKGNPLGRIISAYESNTKADTETLTLKLDDAILREVPKLENGLNLIKVAAAVAPLLGLLGTVTGMIKTFEAIKLFGAGDPKIMAGGISEALVTTELGLIAAIPLLILHAFAAGSAKSISQILEEQTAGMIAEHAESSR